jgi:hypothetical protein
MQRLASMALIMFAVSVEGCGGNHLTDPSTLVSTDVLMRALEDHGIRVVRIEEMPRQSHPYFSVAATRLSVSGENV